VFVKRARARITSTIEQLVEILRIILRHVVGFGRA
jgi:hypothetical protein